jgi:hypothetical protein
LRRRIEGHNLKPAGRPFVATEHVVGYAPEPFQLRMPNDVGLGEGRIPAGRFALRGFAPLAMLPLSNNCDYEEF